MEVRNYNLFICIWTINAAFYGDLAQIRANCSFATNVKGRIFVLGVKTGAEATERGKNGSIPKQ